MLAVKVEAQQEEDAMRSKAGLSAIDVLILVGIVLLLAALAIPRFVKAPDFGDEPDEPVVQTPATNATDVVDTNKESSAETNAASPKAAPDATP